MSGREQGLSSLVAEEQRDRHANGGATASSAGSSSCSGSLPPVPTELQDQLMVMGFPEEWCALALRENGNDIISASSWIVDNLDMLTRLSELQRGGRGEQREGDEKEGEEEEDEEGGEEHDGERDEEQEDEEEELLEPVKGEDEEDEREQGEDQGASSTCMFNICMLGS